MLHIDVQPLPDTLKVDKREKVIHARWLVTKNYNSSDNEPKQKMDIDDLLNGTFNKPVTNTFTQNEADEDLLSGCFDMMKDIFDPRHMTADMVQTCK